MHSDGMSMDDMREAHLGILRYLRAKFGARFAEQNADDLFGQACSEYAGWLAEERKVDNPVGWLIHCARWRAMNLLDHQRRLPPTVSIETIFNAVDESSPAPEAAAIETEGISRLHQAIDLLPEKDGALLRLFFFENHSIREAGRKLKWRKSAAQRHYEAGVARLRALLGDDFDRDA